MHVLQCCRAKTEPFLAVSDALANQCTKSYHVASVVHMYQIWKETSVRRVWVVKISAGMVLTASANSNGDKGPHQRSLLSLRQGPEPCRLLR